MIHVLATIHAKLGMRDKVLAIFHENISYVRAEKGCIEYGAVIDAEDAPDFQRRLGSDTMLVIERWESMTALNQHANSPHVTRYRSAIKPFVASGTVQVLLST